MNWDDLKFVLAVSRAKTFQGASRLLKVTHTTVGRRIKTLESRLGKPLFERKDGVCAPTQECQILLDSARRIETEIHSIDHDLNAAPGSPSGSMRISTMDWVINYFLVPAFPGFTERYPKLQIYFVGELFDDDHDQSKPGMSLRFDLQPGKHELSYKIASFGYAIYGPADCDSGSIPWVSFHGGNFGFGPSEWMTNHGVSIHDIPLLGNDAAIVHRAIQAGVGKGLIPECLGENDPALMRLSDKKPELTRHLRAIVDPGIIMLPAANSVLNWLKETLNTGGGKI